MREVPKNYHNFVSGNGGLQCEGVEYETCRMCKEKEIR